LALWLGKGRRDGGREREKRSSDEKRPRGEGIAYFFFVAKTKHKMAGRPASVLVDPGDAAAPSRPATARGAPATPVILVRYRS
jgi:hypothetical protein